MSISGKDWKWVNDPGPVKDDDFVPDEVTLRVMAQLKIRPEDVPDQRTEKIYREYLRRRSKL